MQWHFAFLVHNLSLSEPVGNQYIAVVPPTDDRIKELYNHKTFTHLLNHFTDQFGRKKVPSILIAHESVPKHFDAIRDFRNALAISAVSFAWESNLSQTAVCARYNYSGYFDLYPYVLSKDHDILIVNSPSILGIDEPLEFRGQTAPELASVDRDIDWFDPVLLDALLHRWTERYVKGIRKKSTEALFRSLEMAYRASAMPYANRGSLHDYGAQLALWISAHEILVWHLQRHANLVAVMQVLGGMDFDHPTLRRKRYAASKGKRVTLLQRLYYDMYRARNHFLHGNPITLRGLYPFRQIKKPALTAYAPIVFKSALYTLLNLWASLSEDTGESLKHFLPRRRYAGALRSARPSSPSPLARQPD